MHKQRLAILIVAAIGVISAFLPWATVSSFLGTISVSGIEGDGMITLIVFIIAGVLAFLGDQKEPATFDVKFKWSIVGAGVVAALLAIIAMTNVASVGAGVGFGTFLSILAGIVIAVIPFLDPEMFNNIGGNK